MQVIDERDDHERELFPWLVVGTDKFLSGWGGALGGKSYAAWACRDHEHAAQVEKWVRGRSDMARVRVVREPYRPGRGCVHFHIYKAAECCPEGWKED